MKKIKLNFKNKKQKSKSVVKKNPSLDFLQNSSENISKISNLELNERAQVFIGNKERCVICIYTNAESKLLKIIDREDYYSAIYVGNGFPHPYFIIPLPTSDLESSIDTFDACVKQWVV